MQIIEARNVNDAYYRSMIYLRDHGVFSPSRNGEVLVSPLPVTIIYSNPLERVLFNPIRDSNPFFTFFEALWMLAGRNDVEFVSQFNSNMAQYSDDGKIFHGAYGYRWRYHFGKDQIEQIISLLINDTNSRRTVLQMWDTNVDLYPTESDSSKDICCNLNIVFSVKIDYLLDMLVFNRSNDALWGALGTNAVHFSYLHEYIARATGNLVGKYYQISADFHAYTAFLKEKKILESLTDHVTSNHYNFYCSSVYPYWLESYELRLKKARENWDKELNIFLKEPFDKSLKIEFFTEVARPLYAGYRLWKDKSSNLETRLSASIKAIQLCKASDWRLACDKWIRRRYNNLLEKQKNDIP